VVVGWSVEPLTQLHNKFKKVSLLVNGQIDAKKKKAREHLFDNDPEKRILFGNVKSIGTGINLVAASTMVFLELPLTAVDFDQVKGRIDRISQKSKALSYYYMTIRKSIEEKKVWKMIHRKQKLSGDLGV
jgi:SNF2 family DNA or RNA helicase